MKVTMKDGSVKNGGFEEDFVKKAFWHTSAHILAQAVKRLYPKTKCSIGPAIDNGFYYDFDFDFKLTDENLKDIEQEMAKIVKESLPLVRVKVSRDEAIKYMKNADEPYKCEIIENIGDNEEITFFKQGEYQELCAGPHISNTSHVKAFKLTAIAGAYLHGDAKNKMLTRIYGISFPKAAELNEYLKRQEEAKKRDHRKIGREMELFTFMNEGPGFPFFLPKGMVLKNVLLDYWRNIHSKRRYIEISTPMMLNRSLWETSGHWEHYKENMYTTVIDGADFAIKPMNCPGGMLVYKMKPHSYKELPIRMCELGLVHRHEKSGQLHGLMRARCFTQDDAHIFMRRDQIESEVTDVIKLIDEVYGKFGFEYSIELSTRPQNSMGSDEDWEAATDALINAVNSLGMSYEVNEGDGAFYGPKLDFHLKDSIGRTWQCGTIQLDFQLPQRFEAEYIDADMKKQRPIMLHRVVFGSVERFIGILTEHYAGKFPLWLAPVQVKVLPVSEKFSDYAQNIVSFLQSNNIRCEADMRDEKLGYKIREAETEKVPYMLIIGQKELKNNTVSVRSRDSGDMGELPLNGFLKYFSR